VDQSSFDAGVLDRAAGVVLGGAIGDALGAGYEFAQPPLPAEVTMLPGTLTGAPAGYWTDDTAMAIAVLEVAAVKGTLVSAEALAAVGERFLEWYRSGPSDIGIHTSAVLSNARTGADLYRAARTAQSANPHSASNGSLMRTGPVALPHLGDTARLTSAAAAVSNLTHVHTEAVEACTLWTLAVAESVSTGKLASPRVGLSFIGEARRDFWEQKITEAEELDPLSFSPNGYVVTALQAAWSAIHATKDYPNHFDAGLRQAVAIGNDTDTVAAIAGYLLGAAYGAAQMPSKWVEGLRGWPSPYEASDLVDMAHRTVSRADVAL
jgi:ADP-ribosylglycohydrolase